MVSNGCGVISDCCWRQVVSVAHSPFCLIWASVVGFPKSAVQDRNNY